MKRETLLTVSVIVLLLLNLGTLYHLLTSRGTPPHHHGPPHHRPDELMIETLKWNNDQISRFEEYKYDHRQQMDVLRRQARENAEAYFYQLGSHDVSKADSFARVMGEIEMKKAGVTYAHLQDLKSICDDEQKAKFDSLLPQLVQILVGGPPPPHRH